MVDKQAWNDESRQELRERLRSHILGELRLARRSDDDVLRDCHETYIMDDCPEEEADEFNQFAIDEMNRVAAQLEAERATWADVTDCDRLDGVEAALREQGIMLWQASPCCDTCTCSELGMRIDELDSRYPGFSKRVRGYTFFIDQNLPDVLSESTDVSVYLGYGWFVPANTNVDEDTYREHALDIAGDVCQCLRAAGFEPDWNGDFARKIGLSLNWQRRTLLE